jgi:hypothetical protein
MERIESENQSIDEILSEFSFEGCATRERKPNDRWPITLWVTPEVKDHYDRIQLKSKKKFIRTLAKIVSSSIMRIVA